jgi:mannose-1-phosphate guanylyltransferase/mannose-1-phosphate guanylyltransferase/mannose-6-phosphate isomerase
MNETPRRVQQGLIQPVILCGGSGTRLWPLSRASCPKQFLSLTEPRTMLQATAARVRGGAFAEPLVVAGESLGALVEEQLRDGGLGPPAIILEPAGRNTAAAIAVAAYWLKARGGDDIMLVMPSDHLIQDEPAFKLAVAAALPAVRDGALATFGIAARSPETGYGYIGPGREWAESPGAFAVERFFEKPDAATAARFCASGYLWNGGIFLFRVSAFLAELERHAPEVARQCAAAMAEASSDGAFVMPEAEAFLASPSIAVDVAVMERTDRACVVPVDMGWSDLGSWDAVWTVSEKDEAGNAVDGDVLAIGASGSLIRNASGLTIAAVGVEDLVIVATADSILIVPRGKAQQTGLAAAAFAAHRSTKRQGE